jgi:hypothetical protein
VMAAPVSSLFERSLFSKVDRQDPPSPQLDFIHFLRTEKPCDIST